MELQVVLPDESAEQAPGLIAELAVLAERLGYRAVWLPDHVLPPEPYGLRYGGVYEPLVTLAHAAALTESVRLGTSVLVLPLRDPFLTAKQVATVHALSGGRMVLGAGVGWERREFAAMRVPFAGRGARAEEALRLVRRLFGHGGGPFEGEHYGFGEGVFAPVPSTPVPIMLGGVSEVALRRAAAYADVWQSLPSTPEEFAERLGRLRAHGGTSVAAAMRVEWTGERPLPDFVGDVARWRDAGVEQLAVWFGPAEGFADRMRRLADALELSA